ncbi:YybH family protein [Ponticoccus litoralis]|uniref:Nuclear transport factor 2 family protein n=1 Tax=Ponticoccus litoralis TaxID=422297 RepID=A0AAW9SL69_9RHOB
MTTTFEVQTFTEFMKAREDAARAYVTGRPDLVLDLSATSGPASFFDPSGRVVTGADAVNKANRDGARSFGPGGKTFFEVLDQGEADGMAYWSGYQVAEVMLDGATEPQAMRLRVTEIFRAGEDGWKMIHRHASPAAEG